MRRLLAALVTIAMLASALPAHAQTTDVGVATGAVREGVRQLRDYSASQRGTQAWGGIIGGLLSGALGGYALAVGLDEDKSSYLFIGAGLGVVGATNIVTGIYSLTTASATEQTAQLLLNSPEALGTAGYIFLGHHAEAARQARILGGWTTIASGLSSGLLLIPVLTDDDDESVLGISDTVWVIAIGTTATLNVINGTLALFGTSVPEQIFGKVQAVVGGSSVAWSVNPGGVHDGEKLVPGLVLEGRF